MRDDMIARAPLFEDIATFVIAMCILVGSFYGLLREGGSTEVRIIYGGLIGAVSTFYFQRAATKAAGNSTIDAQNNGMGQMRQAVARIEDGRPPTDAERVARDAPHR